MARTYKTRTIALRIEIYEGLQKQKEKEHRFGSFNSFVCEILDQYIRDSANVKHVSAVRVRRVGAGEQRKTA